MVSIRQENEYSTALMRTAYKIKQIIMYSENIGKQHSVVLGWDYLNHEF